MIILRTRAMDAEMCAARSSLNFSTCGSGPKLCTSPIVRENTRPPGVRTMCSSDESLLPIQTPLMNTASPLCQRFPPCRPRCVGFTIGQFVRRHPVAFRFVSTDLAIPHDATAMPSSVLSAPKVSLLPNRIWQSARIVRDCSSTAWIARSAGFDAELCFGVVSNFTRSPDTFFTLFARATVAGSPSHLNRTCL